MSASGLINDETGSDSEYNNQSPSKSHKERRREAHTQAEQKRRDAIKKGYDYLQELLVPLTKSSTSPQNVSSSPDHMLSDSTGVCFDSNGSVKCPSGTVSPGTTSGDNSASGISGSSSMKYSKASVLHNAIEYIRQAQEEKESQENELNALNKEVVALQIMRSNYEQLLKAHRYEQVATSVFQQPPNTEMKSGGTDSKCINGQRVNGDGRLVNSVNKVISNSPTSSSDPLSSSSEQASTPLAMTTPTNLNECSISPVNATPNNLILPSDIKFETFKLLMDYLFESFDVDVKMSNFTQLSACVFNWLENECKPHMLQELMYNILQKVKRHQFRSASNTNIGMIRNVHGGYSTQNQMHPSPSLSTVSSMFPVTTSNSSIVPVGDQTSTDSTYAAPNSQLVGTTCSNINPVGDSLQNTVSPNDNNVVVAQSSIGGGSNVGATCTSISSCSAVTSSTSSASSSRIDSLHFN